VFGTVVEKSCIFLIDTSGSMDQHMDELKKELIHLVWEQLHKYSVRSAYSSSLPSSAKEDMFVSLFVDWLVGWSISRIIQRHVSFCGKTLAKEAIDWIVGLIQI